MLTIQFVYLQEWEFCEPLVLTIQFIYLQDWEFREPLVLTNNHLDESDPNVIEQRLQQQQQQLEEDARWLQASEHNLVRIFL